MDSDIRALYWLGPDLLFMLEHSREMRVVSAKEETFG